jgi:cytochrome c oxidase subunit 2
MSRNLSWIVFTSAILLLVACSPLVWNTGRGRVPFGRSISSNGERIYFTGTSVNGPIGYSASNFGGMMGGRGMMGRRGAMGGRLACVDCHGPDARGGEYVVHMTVIDAPDIRWSTLTEAGHGEHGDEEGDHTEEGEEMEHPPFTVETFKRAVTEGVEPDGELLDEAMPRWNMSDQDLEDLIAFLEQIS